MLTPSYDKALLTRIRLLGLLLARVLKEQVGADVYHAVENLRRGFVQLRKKEDPAKRRELIDTINSLDEEALGRVIKAFTTYFSLVNIAEESFYLGERRKEAEKGGHFWRGSFHDTLLDLKQQGVSAEDLKVLFKPLLFMPVMTAHPTEAKRRTLKSALRGIFLTNDRLDAARGRRFAAQQALDKLKSQIQVLWKTDAVRARKPDVQDEIAAGLFYFPLSLFKATTFLFRNFELAVRDVYGKDASEQIQIPSFLRFGSWIGGDRDGNPFVKPETTALAVRLQAQTIFQEYLRRLDDLRNSLTFSYGLCNPSEAFIHSLETDIRELGEMGMARTKTYTQEPYRHKLALMKIRMEHNLEDVERRLQGFEPRQDQWSYPNAAAFLKELQIMRESLIGHGDISIANRELRDFVRLVEVFGFHLMELDVRQESTRHTEAVAEILKLALDIDYTALSEQDRLPLLGEAIAHPDGLTYHMEDLSEASVETLHVFQVMAQMRREISPDCFGQYVISMTHAASHVLEVMLLASQSGLVGRIGGKWYCHIGVSPLFETIKDLEHIESVLEDLLGIPLYRQLLATAGNRQEIMVGYSDSCKDGGILASAWNLYEAQKKIVAIAEAKGIECRIFHGRGGTIGRGGGPTREAILAQPPGTVRGQIKFTEQGEMLFYKYSNMETAIYELTVGITGMLEASTSLIQPARNEREDYLSIMREIAETGESRFRELTERTEGFLDYFYESTPVNEIGLLNIGSRPSHRKKQDRSKQSVRAIAWVFAWAQSRQTLPAWYGIGYALAAWRQDNPQRLEKLRAMYRDWPFFRNLLSNAQMALSKSELSIAKEYAKLCSDREVGELIYNLINEEYMRSIQQILDVADIHALLEENPALSASLDWRNTHLAPLNYIQIALLKRLRAEQEENIEENRWMAPLLRTINAIAAGMRNTG